MNSTLKTKILQLTAENIAKLPKFKEIYTEAFPGTSFEKALPYPKDVVYVIAENKSAVGFCCVHDTTPDGEKINYIYNFCVAKAARGRGCGGELMKFVKEKYNNKLKLHTALSNPHLRWIIKQGWEIVKIVKSFAEMHAIALQSSAPERAMSIVEAERKKRDTSRFDEEEGVIYMT